MIEAHRKVSSERVGLKRQIARFFFDPNEYRSVRERPLPTGAAALLFAELLLVPEEHLRRCLLSLQTLRDPQLHVAAAQEVINQVPFVGEQPIEGRV